MRRLLPALAVCALITAGCGMELTKQEGQRRSAASGIGGMASGDLLDSPAAKPAPSQPASPQETAQQPPEQPAQAQSQPAETGKAPPNTTAAQAEVTVGAKSDDPGVERAVANRKMVKKGQYKESGMIITPIKAYFQTKARTELEVKVPYAVKLYQAEHGYFPKTPEDFMRDIIEGQNIQLPELPAGHRYVYDPETGDLEIERPAK